MGNWLTPYLRKRSGPADRSSPYKILKYFNEFLFEFVTGLILAFLVFCCFLFYSGVPADPTLTVQGTNEKNVIILASFVLGFVGVMGLKGSFGFRLHDVQVNPYMNLFTLFVGVLDSRVNKFSWWYAVRALLYMGSNSAGAIAAAYFVKYAFPSGVLPTSLLPQLAKTTIGTSGGFIVISMILYAVYFHVALMTINGTIHQYVNLFPLTMFTTVVNMIYFLLCRSTTNFAINWAYAIFTGYYEVLWQDVVGFLIGGVFTLAVYWCFTQPFYEPEQAIRSPHHNLQLPWENAADDYSSPKKKKKQREMTRDSYREKDDSPRQPMSASVHYRHGSNVFD